ncbi:hypothetical protein KJ632_04170 [Patescibacteria group bacterium]|nr:hypothetical protein [Patescibacteria group bacterium]
MKKILVLLLLVFVGCGGELVSEEAEPGVVGKRFFMVGDNYFEYYEGSVVGEDFLEYQGCMVGFGEGERILAENEYAFYSEAFNFSFWGDLDCKWIVDELGESFSDTPRYINNKYGFTFEFLPRFEVNYLPNEAGVIMSRRADTYNVEISVNVYDDVLGYKSLGEYLAGEYEGYSMDFIGDMAFLNEDYGVNARRKYVYFSDDYVLEACLKVPREKFIYHSGGFDDFVKTFKFF